MPVYRPARWAMPCCRKPTGNFCTDFKNIGNNTPIPVVALTAASRRPLLGHPRDRRVRLTGADQVVAVTLLR
jgi:hypothetical protein